MSGQRCGLASSVLLSQTDVFIWVALCFLPLLLFYIIHKIFHSTGYSLPVLLHSVNGDQVLSFFSCPNIFGHAAQSDF